MIPFPIIRIIIVLACISAFQIPGRSSDPVNTPDIHMAPGLFSGTVQSGHNLTSEGYRAIARYGDGFLAAGSDGRIDHISSAGEILKSEKIPGESFNCLLTDSQNVIIAGNNGSVFISAGQGIFRKVESGTASDIRSLTCFKESIIAGADHGEIIISDGKGNFKKVRLTVKGNIVSVSARPSDCFGVTDKGEIIHSVNGTDWVITDFNKVYKGYYKPCNFTRILVTEKRIAITGMQDDGSPVLLFSNLGNVWTERTLNYKDDQGNSDYLTDIPSDILYDDPEDRFFLACSSGKLMILPSCSQCNKLVQISDEDLNGIASNKKSLMVAGGHFYVKSLNFMCLNY